MERCELEARLERIVRGNRFTIAVIVPLAGAALLVAGAESLLPSALAFNPALLLVGTLAMRLPVVTALLPAATRRTGIFLLGTVAYTYAIELVGVTTGWPYGDFVYGVDLGPMIAGVPLALPVFFLPLALNAILFARLLLGPLATRRILRGSTAVGLVIAIDLVLDPGAVALGFWTYAGGGPYYGVPPSNFVGWILSGSIAVLALELGFPAGRLDERLEACEFALDDFVSFLLLWGAVNAVYANWLPVAITILLTAGLLQADRSRSPIDGGDLNAAIRRMV